MQKKCRKLQLISRNKGVGPNRRLVIAKPYGDLSALECMRPVRLFLNHSQKTLMAEALRCGSWVAAQSKEKKWHRQSRFSARGTSNSPVPLNCQRNEQLYNQLLSTRKTLPAYQHKEMIVTAVASHKSEERRDPESLRRYPT